MSYQFPRSEYGEDPNTSGAAVNPTDSWNAYEPNAASYGQADASGQQSGEQFSGQAPDGSQNGGCGSGGRPRAPPFGFITDPTVNQFLVQVNPDLFISKLFYFFFYSAFGSLFPLMAVYFKQLGMNPIQAGTLIGVRPFVEYISAPFWASIADRFRKYKAILLFSLTCWIVFTFAQAFIRPPASACVIFNETHHILYSPYSDSHEQEEVVDDTVTLWPSADLLANVSELPGGGAQPTTTEGVAENPVVQAEMGLARARRGKSLSLLLPMTRTSLTPSLPLSLPHSLSAHSLRGRGGHQEVGCASPAAAQPRGGQVAADGGVHPQLQQGQARVVRVAALLHHRVQVGQRQGGLLPPLPARPSRRILQCARTHARRHSPFGLPG